MGTMKEADEKSKQRFCIVATVLVILVALCTYVIDTDIQDMFQRQTSLTKYLGIGAFGLSIYWIWSVADYTFNERQGWIYGAGALVAMLLGICLATGFNFDYFGL